MSDANLCSDTVFLGTLGEPVSSHGSTTFLDSKAGGLPDWISPPSEGLQEPSCALCSKKLVLVSQIYCPVDELHHRVLYIFGCNTLVCAVQSASWVVVRMKKAMDQTIIQEVSKQVVNAPPVQATTDWGAIDWNDDASASWTTDTSSAWGTSAATSGGTLAAPTGSVDAWSISSGSKEAAVDVEQLLALRDLSLAAKTAGNKPSQRAGKSTSAAASTTATTVLVPGCLPSFYMYVDEEPESTDSTLPVVGEEKVQGLLQEYLVKEQQGGAGEAIDPEEYESGAEKLLRKFQKRISRVPLQVVRYQYGGEPLVINSEPIAPSACVCGAKRMFECQLMAPLLFLLDVDTYSVTGHGMDWGTVMVFTCEEDCGIVSQEVAIVQNFI